MFVSVLHARGSGRLQFQPHVGLDSPVLLQWFKLDVMRAQLD
jgi:hypothetical protein